MSRFDKIIKIHEISKEGSAIYDHMTSDLFQGRRLNDVLSGYPLKIRAKSLISVMNLHRTLECLDSIL